MPPPPRSSLLLTYRAAATVAHHLERLVAAALRKCKPRGRRIGIMAPLPSAAAARREEVGRPQERADPGRLGAALVGWAVANHHGPMQIYAIPGGQVEHESGLGLAARAVRIRP